MGPFFGKPLRSVTLEDLQRLVTGSVPESLHLDYKRELKLDDRDEKKEFLRDVTALANAQGGTIIYGIDEDRGADNKPTGLPKAVEGFVISNRDSFILSLEHLLKDGIEERLSASEIATIETTAGKTVILLRIPPSLRAPHMVILAGERRFFMRGNSGRQEMSVSQIRDAILRTEELGERIRRFVSERLTKVRGQGVNGPLWMLHVTPLVRDPVALDVADQAIIDRLLNISGPHGGNPGYCLEGFRIANREPDGDRSHTLIFRDGTVEILDQYCFEQSKKFFAYGAFGEILLRLLDRVMNLYREGLLQVPVALSITLSGVHGFALPPDPRSMRGGHPLEEDQVGTDSVVLVDIPSDVKTAIRPSLDLIWNAFGYPKCPAYNADGKYVGYR